MDELREVAKAYYLRATKEEQEAARRSFNSMDENRNGNISLQEFMKKHSRFDPNGNIFKILDENGDGTLDFDEFLAFHYITKVQIFRCDSCRDLMSGNYFSCLLCLGNGGCNTYDVCLKCYAGGKFTHKHAASNFMDAHARHMLLREIMSKSQITQTRATGHDTMQVINTAANVGSSLVRVGNAAVDVGNYAHDHDWCQIQ